MMTKLQKTGLRFMVYDSTYLKDEVFTKDDSLTYSWILGGNLYAALNRFDYQIKAENWLNAIVQMVGISQAKGRHIEEIQFWGHGSPGRVWIGRDSLSLYDLRHDVNNPLFVPLNDLRAALTEESVVWFRTCSTFCGFVGQTFAMEIGDLLECRVAGHTHIIHGWQGGLHSLYWGQNPSWDPAEGVKWGTPERVVRTKWTIPFKTPNTIFCLTADIPKDW